MRRHNIQRKNVSKQMWMTINQRGYEVERQKLRDEKKEPDREIQIYGDAATFRDQVREG